MEHQKAWDINKKEETAVKTKASEAVIPIPNSVHKMLIEIKKNPQKKYTDSMKMIIFSVD
ncbi:hypothetical protein [Siminovitchia fortis]|uniref:hypothetical protein n=1 Tax=Siminovitchia fortis TaxID=254758 RepID=UPI0011A6C6BE|nr:hypothetical protein [Siminovitchia fortis]